MKCALDVTRSHEMTDLHQRTCCGARHPLSGGIPAQVRVKAQAETEAGLLRQLDVLERHIERLLQSEEKTKSPSTYSGYFQAQAEAEAEAGPPLPALMCRKITLNAACSQTVDTDSGD